MTKRRLFFRAPFAAAVSAGVLLLASCGGATNDSTESQAVVDSVEPSEPADSSGSGETDSGEADSGDADSQSSESSALPSVEMLALPSGDSVDLASLAPSPTPLLLWFWAPH